MELYSRLSSDGCGCDLEEFTLKCDSVEMGIIRWALSNLIGLVVVRANENIKLNKMINYLDKTGGCPDTREIYKIIDRKINKDGG